MNPFCASKMIASIAVARHVSAKLKPSRRWQQMKPTGDRQDGGELWKNHVYVATLRRFPQGWPLGNGPWATIGIWCEDGEARHDWRDFQRIKNDLVGPEWEAIELYPRESRLLDPSNYYILWAAPEIKIGKYEGRRVTKPAECLAPQRPWTGEPDWKAGS